MVEWLDFEYILKVEFIVFVDNMRCGMREKEEVRRGLRFWVGVVEGWSCFLSSFIERGCWEKRRFWR